MAISSTVTAPVWKDSYRVGSEMIDTQHQRLFELLAQLIDAQNGDCDPAVVNHAVSSLYGYIRIHFDDEERLMEELNYDGRRQHEQQHNSFILAFDDLVTVHRDDRDLPRLVSFMHQWLVNHIINEDTDIRRIRWAHPCP